MALDRQECRCFVKQVFLAACNDRKPDYYFLFDERIDFSSLSNVNPHLFEDPDLWLGGGAGGEGGWEVVNFSVMKG